MKRQNVLDTETTGFNPKSGDKLVEIGVVELIDGVKTGKVYHQIINPMRLIPADSTAIHNITDEDVKGKPVFKDMVDGFLKFIEGSELIIHKADFDVKFINEELERAGKGKLLSYVTNVRCSLELSKALFPKPKKQKGETPEEEAYRKLGYSLDSMCDRLNVDRTHRIHHLALLDADLLADMFIKINEKFPLAELEEQVEQRAWVRPEHKIFEGLNLTRVSVDKKDLEAHLAELDVMEKENKVTPVFKINKTATLKI